MKLVKKLKHGYFAEQIKNFRCKFLEDDYQILGFLGQGSTSRVFLGSNILTNDRVVVKVFKSIPEDKIFRQIRVNNKINQYCQNLKYQSAQTKNIPLLQLLDVVRNKGHGSYAFIFQYFAGSPMHMTPISVIKQKRLEFIKQIIEALKIVHSARLIHRDLKPSNILITNKGAKLFDFGLSKQIGIDELKTNRFGTKCYYPPEVIFRMPQYDEKLDIWTCGIIFSELITLIKPILPYKSDLQTLNQVINFCDYNQQQQSDVIRQDFKRLIPNKNYSKSFESYASNLRRTQLILPQLNEQKFHLLVKTIKRMLRINPQLRPSAAEILQDLQPIFHSFK